MRLWIKRLWCHHIWPFHGILVCFFVLMAFFLGVQAGERPPQNGPARRQIPGQENCALCESSRRHAPCLIDLSTGEVGELRVYTPHPHLAGEIADEQQTGTLDFFYCAGIVATCDTNDHICRAYLPAETEPMAPEQFCRDCRALVSGICTEGYVLADLYDLDDIQVYAIADGKSYIIRDYTVTVSGDENAEKLKIEVAGSIS